jgi:hypothetical protein
MSLALLEEKGVPAFQEVAYLLTGVEPTETVLEGYPILEPLLALFHLQKYN